MFLIFVSLRQAKFLSVTMDSRPGMSFTRTRVVSCCRENRKGWWLGTTRPSSFAQSVTSETSKVGAELALDHENAVTAVPAAAAATVAPIPSVVAAVTA